MNGTVPRQAEERLIALPFRAIPVAPDFELVFASSQCRLLSPLQGRLLRSFSTLRGPGESKGAPADAKEIETLKGMGLLVGEGQILARLRAGGPDVPASGFRSIGIPTCNRPTHLANCVRSLINNANAFGRRLEISVVDVSPASKARDENISRLKHLSSAADIRYCGPKQRQEFWARLGALGVARDVCDSGLRAFDAEGNFGAARNALLLDHAGEAFLSADDDTLACAAIHPSLQAGFRLVGRKRQVFDRWFFTNRRAAFKWARWETIDIVGEHAALLGRSVSSVLSSSVAPIQLERMCGHFADAEWPARIVGTMAGRVGDSGRSDPAWDIRIGNWYPGRTILGRAEVAELPESAVIGHQFGCVTTMIGLDLRSILPPFFPRHDGEDGLFAILLDRLMPNTCWGVVPHGIAHDRPPRGIERALPFAGLCAMKGAQLSRLPARRGGRSDEEAIRDAGADLCRIVEAGARDLRNSTLEHLAITLSPPLGELRKLRESGLPLSRRAQIEKIWERDIFELRRLCEGPGESQAGDFSWASFGAELHEYGRLLQHWPEIFQAACGLRADGFRISAGLDSLA